MPVGAMLPVKPSPHEERVRIGNQALQRGGDGQALGFRSVSGKSQVVTDASVRLVGMAAEEEIAFQRQFERDG